jgi:hypothetical protein
VTAGIMQRAETLRSRRVDDKGVDEEMANKNLPKIKKIKIKEDS